MVGQVKKKRNLTTIIVIHFQSGFRKKLCTTVSLWHGRYYQQDLCECIYIIVQKIILKRQFQK